MKKKLALPLQHVLIGVISLMLGFLLVIQSESFEEVTELLQRDKETSVFQEIAILKQRNEDLEGEVDQLQSNLEDLDDKDSALELLDEEIKRYKILSGKFPIAGPGFEMVIEDEIATQWMIDLVNEFFNAGAEAIDVNEIRIANHTLGFDTLPQGQILLNGSVLTAPYKIRVIGEASVIRGVLETPGGLLDRVLANYPELEVRIQELDLITMR